MHPTAQERIVGRGYARLMQIKGNLVGPRSAGPRESAILPVTLSCRAKTSVNAVEALRPFMAAAKGIDKLNVDPQLVAGSLDTAFEHVSDPELLRDLLRRDGPVLVYKRRIASDDEQAGDLRQVGCQVVGNSSRNTPAAARGSN